MIIACKWMNNSIDMSSKSEVANDRSMAMKSELKVNCILLGSMKMCTWIYIHGE